MRDPSEPLSRGDAHVRLVVRTAGESLVDKGFSDGILDAEVLMADLLGVNRAFLYTSGDVPSPQQLAEFHERVARREDGEPVAYITGQKEFYSLRLTVDPRVMIPRPETEHLVEEAIRFLRDERGGSGTVADIGTGSGAIAVAVAEALAGVRAIATDISGEALEVAKANAHRHHVDDRIRFSLGDLEVPLYHMGGAHLDALLSNPPYVVRREAIRDDGEIPPEWAEVDAGVEKHEPARAIFAAGDPRETYRRLAGAAANLLKDGGLLAVEVGAGMAEDVSGIFWDQEGLGDVRLIADLAGIDRVVTARREGRTGAADG